LTDTINKAYIKWYTKNLELYKILNYDEKHYNYQYCTGLNILKEQFNSNKKADCGPGGLYFTQKDYISYFKNYGKYVRKVSLPWDDKDFKIVMIDGGLKFRANKIILDKIHSPIDTF
jgi:hypothetical protein